jgi:hypothetical protein
MNKYTTDSFGDVRKFPVLKRLADSLNEINSPNTGRYVSRYIKEMHLAYKASSKIESHWREYFYRLIQRDFLQRLDLSTLDGRIYDYLRNYTLGYCNHQINKFPI